MASVESERPEGERERQMLELREVNEALLVSSVHQHELTEEAQRAEAMLRRSEAQLRLEAENLSRFNRVAVGRESRMIELKREINELLHRLGELPRYPLGFEAVEAVDAVQEGPPDATPETRAGEARMDDTVAPLETILCTEELARRPSRPPDYQAEVGTLVSLVAALADSPGEALQLVAQKSLEVLEADTAGLSVLSADEQRFHWSAIAGTWHARAGGGAPRKISPCGDALDRNTPLLLQHLERRYPHLRTVVPLAKEALFVPFYVAGKAVGAIWALRHSDRQFDAEDLRQLQNLGRVASAAYRGTEARALALSRTMAALNLTEDALRSRRAVEKAYLDLSASEERYHSLFNSIDEGFCLVEMLFESGGKPMDFRFLETNPAFEKQSGLHGAVGKCVRALVPRIEAFWIERYGRVALTGEPTRFVDESRALDGRWFDGYAFRIGAPESRRVAILFTDITERRRLENRTREQANVLADLNRRKDEFLAMLSHELRNPLAAIQNVTDVMQLQRNRDPIQVETQGILHRQVSQLTRLVDDLLDVSRISSGRIRLKLENIDLRGVVHQAVETARPGVDRKLQSLRESLPEDALWVSGDAVRLQQVIVNLLDNASKYTDHEGLIRVTLQKEDEEAVVRVRDTGVGIPPEVLPRIFDLFTQADQSLERAQGGLGVGLALVKSLLTMHGGRVEAHSAPGQGSEFIVRLPALPSLHEPSVDRDEIGRAPAHAVRVLVVEDNPDVARSIARLLKVSGHDVRVAHDGASAIRAAREFAPSVVLLDIGLPVVDGLEVAKWIRQEPGLRNVLLVALTGYGQDSDRQRTREAGFDYHIVKPVSLKEIASILAAAAESCSGNDSRAYPLRDCS
jgi:signal transduction histidine kinase/ActR/RegA family two-component response regulator